VKVRKLITKAQTLFLSAAMVIGSIMLPISSMIVYAESSMEHSDAYNFNFNPSTGTMSVCDTTLSSEVSFNNGDLVVSTALIQIFIPAGEVTLKKPNNETMTLNLECSYAHLDLDINKKYKVTWEGSVITVSEYIDRSSESDESVQHDNDEKSNDDDSDPAPPTDNQQAQNSISNDIDRQLNNLSEAGGFVTINGGDQVNSLPASTVAKAMASGTAQLSFTYYYKGEKYTTIIPAGTVIDPTIQWYGPEFLIASYPTVWHEKNNVAVPIAAPVK